MSEQLIRTELLLGPEAMKRLAECRVAVFGVGGVGGHVCEALARTGIRHFMLVDNDRVSVSNINRQIIATHRTVGRVKVEVMKERILEIDPEAEVESWEASGQHRRFRSGTVRLHCGRHRYGSRQALLGAACRGKRAATHQQHGCRQ